MTKHPKRPRDPNRLERANLTPRNLDGQSLPHSN
jgi:hypothetical protein